MSQVLASSTKPLRLSDFQNVSLLFNSSHMLPKSHPRCFDSHLQTLPHSPCPSPVPPAPYQPPSSLPESPGLLSHTFSSKVVARTSAESSLLQTLFWLQPGAFGRHCLLQFVPSGHLPFSQSFYHALSLVALSNPPSALSAALLFFFIFVKVPGALPPPLPTSSCPPARAVLGKQKFGCQTLPALSPTPTAVNLIGKQLRFCFPPHKKRVKDLPAGSGGRC